MARTRSLADENNLIRSFLNSGKEIPDNFDENLTAFRAGTISARAILNPRTEDSKFVTTGRGRQDVALDEKDVKTTVKKLQAPARQTKAQREAREVSLLGRGARRNIRRQRISKEARRPFERQLIAEGLIDARRQLEISTTIKELLNEIDAKKEDIEEGVGVLEGLFGGTAAKDEQELTQLEVLLANVLTTEQPEEVQPAGNAVLDSLLDPTPPPNEFTSEEEARAAGFQDGDIIVIDNTEFRLAPDTKGA